MDTIDLRTQTRHPAIWPAELIWKTPEGEKHFEDCRAVNSSRDGLAVECPAAIPLCADIVLRAESVNLAALSQVRHCTWNRSSYLLGLRFLATASTTPSDPAAPDHYEILRLSRDADHESISRVYRTLARRFHPDNPDTADPHAFLRLNQAWRILSDPSRRARYDAERAAPAPRPRFRLNSREFFEGIRGEQHRRAALLCLLYRKRMIDHEAPAMSPLDLERLTGFTREEIGFALWYLREKSMVKPADDSQYAICAPGVDHVESGSLHPELLAIAAAEQIMRDHPLRALPEAP